MSSATSIAQKERIQSLDFLRGVAILGILFINIENFAYPDSWSPYKFGFEQELDRTTRFWVYFLTQGKFYTMFALLFGVGFYIFLERLEKKNIGLRAMDIYARRLLWLFVIGVVHAYFIWEGDVLYHYAICGLLLFPFRSIKIKNLWLLVGLLCLIELNISYRQIEKRRQWKHNYELALLKNSSTRSDREQREIDFWKRKITIQPADTSLVKPKKETYIKGLQETYEHAQVHQGTVYYKNLLFRTLMVMILGIILYRSGIFLDIQVWKNYWIITVVVVVVGILINYLRYYQWTYAYFHPVLDTWKEWSVTFSKELLGVGYILLLNGVYQQFLSGKTKAISNIGRTALSNYIFQNALLGLIFYGYGFGWYNQFSRFELLGIVVVIWGLQLILTNLYLNKFDRGPLEAIWRRLTYRSFID